MSQKKLKSSQLDFVFNPANYGVVYYESPTEKDVLNEKKQKQEDDVYNEVVKGLEDDLIKLGMELTYSSKIIIGGIARDIVMLNRIKYQFICKGLLRHKTVLKPDSVRVKKEDYLSKKVSKLISYDNLIVFDSEEIHPIFDKLIPKLDKQIKEGLKFLGLLPVQQIERQKLTIIKKLRQKYEKLDGEYIVKAEKEKRV